MVKKPFYKKEVKNECKDRILGIASRKFMEAGVNNVTLDEVATELGMSKKTVYKYFPSKEILLHAIVKMLLSKVEKEVNAIINSDMPSDQKMIRLLTEAGKHIRHLGNQFKLDLQRLAPSLWNEIDTFRREKILNKIKHIFDQAKREKIFRKDLDIDLFYLVFINTVQGIMNPKTLSEHPFSAEEAFKQIISILLKGALTEKAKSKNRFINLSK